MQEKQSIARVSLAFVNRTVAVIIAFIRNVVTQMTGNPNFTTPYPPLADVTTAADALEQANEAASGGSRIAILDRNAKKATLISLMRQLAAYVQSQSKGSKSVILSSGFHTTKTPVKVGPLSVPENPRLTQTKVSGTLLFRMKRVRGVTAGYTIQVAEAADGASADYGVSPKVTVEITGRTPGKTYWVRACANGTAGPSNWTDAVSAIAT